MVLRAVSDVVGKPLPYATLDEIQVGTAAAAQAQLLGKASCSEHTYPGCADLLPFLSELCAGLL